MAFFDLFQNLLTKSLDKMMEVSTQDLRIKAMEALDDTRSSMALMQAMRVLKSERSSAQDVAKALTFDPGLAQKLVNEVNSPYFALPTKVQKLDHAIALLGFKRVEDLLRRSVSHEMYQHAQTSHFEMVGFQRHGVAVGCLATQLAMALKLNKPEEFFEAGMMHDIGKYLYLTKLSTEFQKLAKDIRETGTPMYQVERKLLGLDHCELGEMMADAWGLSENIRSAVRYHHGITEKERERLTTREVQLVDVITFANLLAHGSPYGGAGWGNKLPCDPLPPPPGILEEADVRQIVLLAEQQYSDLVKRLALD
jgi:HD-like signal output (HDOD) protein